MSSTLTSNETIGAVQIAPSKKLPPWLPTFSSETSKVVESPKRETPAEREVRRKAAEEERLSQLFDAKFGIVARTIDGVNQCRLTARRHHRVGF